MENLPANHKADWTPSSREQAERKSHREWIGGRALTLLSHYWRDDDDEMLTAALGADWADVLEGLPQEVIQRACIQYQREEPRRKPTPGAVYQIAMAFMPKPTPVPAHRPMTQDERHAAEEDRAKGRAINPERKAQADEILRSAGFKAKMGKGETP